MGWASDLKVWDLNPSKEGEQGETDGFFPLLTLHSHSQTKFLLSVSKHFQAESDENKKKKFQQGTVTDLKLISQSWNEKKCRPDGYRNGYGDLVGKRADENIYKIP